MMGKGKKHASVSKSLLLINRSLLTGETEMMGKGKTAAWTSHAITDSGWASDIPDVPGQTSLGTKKKLFSKVLYKRVDPSQCTQGTDCFFFKKKVAGSAQRSGDVSKILNGRHGDDAPLAATAAKKAATMLKKVCMMM
jgi:hypothetical protein